MNRLVAPYALRASVVGCCIWMSMSTARADLNLDAEIGAEHSDNVRRVATDEQSDTIGTARVTLTLEEMRPRLEARIAADVQYRHYFDDSYDSEVVGGLSGDVAWSILPERFIWIVQDNYGQIAADRAQPDTPDNREDINYFTTGPDLRLRRRVLRLRAGSCSGARGRARDHGAREETDHGLHERARR